MRITLDDVKVANLESSVYIGLTMLDLTHY